MLTNKYGRACACVCACGVAHGRGTTFSHLILLLLLQCTTQIAIAAQFSSYCLGFWLFLLHFARFLLPLFILPIECVRGNFLIA